MKIGTVSRVVVGLFTVVALSVSNQSAHGAATTYKTLKADSLVKISYPAIFKLPKSGFGKLSVKYILGDLPIDESAFFVVIEDDEEQIVGQGSWYGTNYEGSVKAMPKQGTLAIKICRKQWYDSANEQDVFAASKGTYNLMLSAVGEMSSDVSSTIKLSD